MSETVTVGAPSSHSRLYYWITFAVIMLAAVAVRVWDSSQRRTTGFDELIYRRYAMMMDGGRQKVAVFEKDMSLQLFECGVTGTGAGSLASLTEFFLKTQEKPGTACELPPTRFLYIYAGWLWKNVRFGDAPALSIIDIAKEWKEPPTGTDRSKDADRRDPALRALHEIAFGFGVLLVLLGGIAGTRMMGPAVGLGVMALMAFDPVLIHLTQHAMVDGFFAFWALLSLWTLWECLRLPGRMGWLIAHALSLVLLVITNRWTGVGKVSNGLLFAMVAGPAAGVLLLAAFAGGVETFIAVYQMLVVKAQNLIYAQQTGDGPWHRYLLDMMTVSPIVLCLGVGALFAVMPKRKELAYLAIFVAGSYLIMCNIRYGMNLRYSSIWSFPLRAAAFLMIWQCCARFGARQWLVAGIMVFALCAYDLRQYWILTSNPQIALYELVPSDLLRLLKIIKA
jgi:hypothetical protein